MVGCPIGKWSVISQTQTGSSLAASRLRMRMRVGSARALNQAAYVSASGSDTESRPGGVQQGAESGTAMRSIVAVAVAVAGTYLVSFTSIIGETLIFVNGLI